MKGAVIAGVSVHRATVKINFFPPSIPSMYMHMYVCMCAHMYVLSTICSQYYFKINTLYTSTQVICIFGVCMCMCERDAYLSHR